MLRTKILVGIILAGMGTLPVPGAAQDAFEVEVYRYETAPRGRWELDAHLNYTARGTTTYDGLRAPTQHQGRLALELTRGITDHWEVTAYLLTAYRPGAGFEYAGWRARTRVRVPKAWRLPVEVGLAGELEFSRPAYDENAIGLEIRLILEKRIGRLQLDLNPVLERGLRAHAGGGEPEWELEPSARVAFVVSQRVAIGLEYFGTTGLPGSPLPVTERAHAFYPGVDLQVGKDLELNVGLGFGTTYAANRLVFKGRFEFPLGH